MKVFLKNWSNWCSIIISVFIFYIGEMSKVDEMETPPGILKFLNSSVYNDIVNYKFIILIGLIIIMIIVQIRYQKRCVNDEKKWLKKFLKHLTEQHLAGGNYNTRITIFREKYGWNFFLIHLWKALTSKNYPLAAVPKPFKKYLAIYVRYCSLEQPKSHTFFKISKGNKTPGGSMVAECFRTGATLRCVTPSIADIELPRDRNMLNKTDAKRVKKYMDDSHIKDYETLLGMQTLSNSILAFSINNEDKRWGVMVFDSLNREPEKPIDFLNKIDSTFINSYQKIVVFTTKQIR